MKRNNKIVVDHLMTIKEDIAGIKQHLNNINGALIDSKKFQKGCPDRRRHIYDKIDVVNRKVENHDTFLKWYNKIFGALGGASVLTLIGIAFYKLFGG